MRFKNLDLNLLIALDVLLQERTVSSAAERLHLSQSALSGALARLRQHFNDELVVSSGRRLVATSLAESLRMPLREAIFQIEAVVTATGDFDPMKSRRTFRLEIPDYLAPVLLSDLARITAVDAPDILLELRLPSGDPAPLLQKGELDLVITPEFYSDPDYVAEPFATQEHVLVGWSKNSSLQNQPDREAFLTMRQVVVRFDRKRLGALPEDEISAYSGAGRIAMVAPNYSSIPASLIGTDRVAIMHERLARTFAATFPIEIWDVPIPITPFKDVMMYHGMRRQDAGLSWLRHLLLRIARGWEERFNMHEKR